MENGSIVWITIAIHSDLRDFCGSTGEVNQGNRMRRTQDEERDDDWQDEGWDDETDEDSDDGYIPCPHCGETMLEVADHCPACNRWITSEDLPRKQYSWWVVVVILILLLMMVLSGVPF